MPFMFKKLRGDIACILERDPAARTWWEVLTCYPGLHAIYIQKLAHWFWLNHLRWLGRFTSHLGRWLTGIEIHPGAKIGSVSPTHLEITADGGWDLVIESDSDGRILAGTRLMFTLYLSDRQLKLNCRPADVAVGNFNAIAGADSDTLDGSFLLKLSQCKNAVSGKNTAGLPVFTVRGENIVRLDWYGSVEQALEAVGLEG